MTSDETLSEAESDRYREALIRTAMRLRYGSLLNRELDAGGHPVAIAHGRGIATLGSTTAELPQELLHAISTFRLANYLSLRYASSQVAWQRALHCEPYAAWSPDDFHLVTFDRATGEILGYVCLVTNGDGGAGELSSPRTARPFPVEQAHGVDLFDTVGRSGMLASDVREVKRFVHRRSMTDKTLRLRVTIDLLHGLVEAFRGPCAHVSTLVGDVEEQAALRHLLLMGLEVHLVTGSVPQLPESDLMFPMYVTRDVVEPFCAAVPDASRLTGLGAQLASVGTADNLLTAAAGLLHGPQGTVVRHTLAGPGRLTA